MRVKSSLVLKGWGGMARRDEMEDGSVEYTYFDEETGFGDRADSVSPKPKPFDISDHLRF